jgi:serine/threonine protein kinase
MSQVVDPRVGTEVAGYRIAALLGRGGMSAVYLAEDPRLGRRIALKILSPELAEDERFRARFRRESQLAASLDHPNIVPIYEAGESDNVFFIAMRYVRGSDLRTVIARDGVMEPTRAVAIVERVSDALDAAHGEGLVHRDVKPANVLISEGGGSKGEHIYLSDFGLTKQASSDSGLTNTGQFMGTVNYVSPEQIRGEEVDGRADIYSLACVLCECLTGEPPFRHDTEVATLYGHLEEAPPSLTARRSDLPLGLDETFAKAMAKQRADRYATAGEFSADVRGNFGMSGGESIVARGTRQRRRRLRWALTVAAGCAVLLASFTVWRIGDSPQQRSSSGVQASASRIDPATSRVVASARDAVRGWRVVAGEGALWVLNSGGLTKRDEQTGQIEARIELPKDTYQSLASGFGSIWVSANPSSVESEVIRIDPATDEVVSRIRFSQTSGGGGNYLPMTTTAKALWVIDGEGILTRINPLTEHVERIHVTGFGSAITAGGGAVWVGDLLSDEVLKIDPETGEVQKSVASGANPDTLAYLNGNVWVHDGEGGTLTPIDAGTLAAGRPLALPEHSEAVVAGFGSIWVPAGTTVVRVDPVTEERTQIPVGFIASCLAVDERTQSVWVIHAPSWWK